MKLLLLLLLLLLLPLPLLRSMVKLQQVEDS